MNDFISNHHPLSRRQGEYISHPQPRPIAVEAASAHQILDSRGWPTVRVRLLLEDGAQVAGAAPAGASTGAHEAVELRDRGRDWEGRGVTAALAVFAGEVAPMLTRHAWASIADVDRALADLDGTGVYARLGANMVVATSIAMARAFAVSAEQPLWQWIARVTGWEPRLPVPHFNVLNGGAHASNDLDFQEFMIAPVSARSEADAVRAGAAVYHSLKRLVQDRFGAVGLGDEGGFAPPLSDPQDALDLLLDAIEQSGNRPGVTDMAIALDPAANGFVTDGGYRLRGRELPGDQLADYYERLLARYPIRSIEDPFHEDDHGAWQQFTQRVGGRLQVVGDDLYVTDAARIHAGADRSESTAALIKPNQIGTVSQTLDAIRAARAENMTVMISHRSGETDDAFIADLAVGTGIGQIKAGAPARGERVAKYNRLTEIEHDASALPYGL